MSASSSYEDSKKVSRANLAFYRAFEKLDAGEMAAVWLRESYVRCIHPGSEMIVGYDAVMASWRAIFQSTERIQFCVHDVDMRVLGDLAWVTLTESVTGGFGPHERGTSVAATNVFERRGGLWRMVLHHASPMMRRVASELPEMPPGIV